MARPPNYGQERKERDRQKALKKAEKANAKAEKRDVAKPAGEDEGVVQETEE